MRGLASTALLIAGLVTQSPAPAVPDVPYVPTPQTVVDAMLEGAGVKPSDTVFDLGSGDGRIVITAAKKYGARGVGIEIDPGLLKKAADNAAAAGVSDRVRFLNQNLFAADIREATVVTLYLLQSINERLRPKLVRELRPGTRIVSHVFNMGPEWPPEKTLEVDRSRIFFWTIPFDSREQALAPFDSREQALAPFDSREQALAQGGQSTPKPAASEEEELARGEELTDRVCTTSCHGIDNITRLRRTPREWNDQVVAMVTRGAVATDAQFTTIKKYLARYYGAVSVNSAPAADLSTVLGLSTKEADAIVEYRKTHGKFADIASLLKVPGIDKSKIEADPDALRFD